MSKTYSDGGMHVKTKKIGLRCSTGVTAIPKSLCSSVTGKANLVS